VIFYGIFYSLNQDFQDLPHQGFLICVYALFWNRIGWEKSW